MRNFLLLLFLLLFGHAVQAQLLSQTALDTVRTFRR